MLQLGEVRLRLEQVVTTPAAVPSAPTDPAQCKFHPRNPAGFLCPKCQGHFCGLCVNTRSAGGPGKYFCRACGVECSTLMAASSTGEAEEQTFMRQALEAFKYPLNGDGLILIAVGAFFFMVLDGAKMLARFAPLYGWVALGFLTVFGVGYLTAYLRLNLNASALGEDKMPDWPEMSGIVSAFFELVGTVAFSFAPAIGLTIFAAVHGGDGDTAWLGWTTTALILLGCVYFPMAFMAVSMYDSITAVNPLLVVPSISKVLREYALTVVLLTVILVLRWLLKNELPALLPVPLLPTIISSLVGLYLLIVEMRILGLLYRNKKHELGWFT